MTETNYSLDYGSDKNGLIWGYLFILNQPAQIIKGEEVRNFLNQPQHEGEFIWLHSALSNASTIPWLKENLVLPESFFDSLGSEISPSRIEQEDDVLVAVIHDVLFGSTFDAAAVGTASLVIQRHVLVSARLRPLRSLEELRNAVRGGHIFHSTVELLAHLLRDQAIVLGDILRRSTIRVDHIEDRLLANLSSTSPKELSSLRRALVRLQRLLAPEPAAFFRLLNRPPDWITSDDLKDLQHAAEEFSVSIGDSTALAERVKLIQEELAATINQQTNQTLFVLTLVTVIALPINIVAGLFGMNVGGVPLANDPNGFTLVVGVLVLFSLVVVYLVFGRNRN